MIKIKIKNLSKLLSIGILLNSMFFNSFASVISEDLRYGTFVGDNITVYDILEEDKVDVEIEGNTLVNLCGEMNSNNTHWILNNGWWELSEEGVLFLDFKAIVKPNTTYTVILNSKLDNSDGILFGFRKDNLQWEGSAYTTKLSGRNKFKFTTTNNEVNRFTIHRLITSGEVATIGVKDILILEGDWTNKVVPNYFKGMKSVGQNDENGHGIEILSQNKNLYSYEKMLQGVQFITKINDISIQVEKENPKDYSYHASDITSLLVDGKSYTLNADISNKELGNYGIDIIRKSDKYREVVNARNFIADTSKYTYTLKFYSNKNPYSVEGLCSVIYSNIQLEYGDISTSVVEPKQNKQEILLKEPLRGLPNGTKDKIIKTGNNLLIERNIGKLILDGNEEWIDSSTTEFITSNDSEHITFFNTLLYGKHPVDAGLISDNFRYLKYDGGFRQQGDYEGISDGGGYNFIFIRINKSKLETPDVEGFKKWLNNNPTTIYYQLKNPTKEYLKVDWNIPIFEGVSYIYNNSIIPTNMQVTVDRALNRAVEYTELAKVNPTIENLSMARMWINLLRESIKKDELQTKLDEEVDIIDLQLERKNTTANLDLYIKSENILQMSLNTNSITFEDFSGVEDMVKENAVNISINSSLPYSLNAYLPTEIQNSDGSNVMDKTILNIKENSEPTYQTFVNTTDKVVLKDNCIAGNSINHGIDIKLKGNIAHEKDVYKTTIKFETEQK